MDEPRPYLAEWWPRVGATLLDSVIVTCMAIAVGLVVDAVGGSDDAAGASVWLGWLVLWAAYAGLLMSRKGAHNGQTLGKQAANIRVVRDDGRPVRFGLAVLRDVGLKYFVANLLIGIGWIIDSLWPLGERENRTLHDLIVHTHVVQTKPRAAPRIEQPRPVARRQQLAPPIARHVDAAHRTQAAIAAAVQRAELPYTAVSTEVTSLVGDIERSAMRAQLLYEALSETPVESVEQRLARVGELEQPELALALREQLVVQRRMQEQLQRFDGEMERMVVELDTVRSNLVSTAASGDAANQERLADRVRTLRDEMSAVSEGMDAGYGQT
ncbi:RDD family protein [Solirubrobacter soli]|uniref:RDD family protein n=1 Tax=Solirubrobacter soli TaxID=363832 RepID=UPI00040859B1|nr:RDD family protein [Solirubrobacter soli]